MELGLRPSRAFMPGWLFTKKGTDTLSQLSLALETSTAPSSSITLFGSNLAFNWWIEVIKARSARQVMTLFINIRGWCGLLTF